ncbi:MAG: hypothetical protein J7K98_01500 [Candidatus Aenigmarchaeota archaeon]|nr:hypothetical protein [Candidatus Aenigmarchaeota archaeon]
MSEIFLIDYFSTSKKTFYHSATTFSKLIFFLCVLFSILLTQSLIFLSLTITILLALIKISDLPLTKILKWALYPTFFASIFAISQLSSSSLLPLLSILKGFSSFLSVILLFSTTPYTKIFYFLSKFSGFLGNVLFLTYRFFFVLLNDVENRIRSLKVRGLYSANKLQTLKNISNLIGHVFLNSIEISEKFYNSLMIRGFKGKFYHLEKESFGLKDLAIIFLGLGILALSGVVGWTL